MSTARRWINSSNRNRRHQYYEGSNSEYRHRQQRDYDSSYVNDRYTNNERYRYKNDGKESDYDDGRYLNDYRNSTAYDDDERYGYDDDRNNNDIYHNDRDVDDGYVRETGYDNVGWNGNKGGDGSSRCYDQRSYENENDFENNNIGGRYLRDSGRSSRGYGSTSRSSNKCKEKENDGDNNNNEYVREFFSSTMRRKRLSEQEDFNLHSRYQREISNARAVEETPVDDMANDLPMRCQDDQYENVFVGDDFDIRSKQVYDDERYEEGDVQACELNESGSNAVISRRNSGDQSPERIVRKRESFESRELIVQQPLQERKKSLLEELGISLDDVKDYLNDEVLETSLVKLLKEKLGYKKVAHNTNSSAGELHSSEALKRRTTNTLTSEEAGHDDGRLISRIETSMVSSCITKIRPPERDSTKREHSNRSSTGGNESKSPRQYLRDQHWKENSKPGHESNRKPVPSRRSSSPNHTAPSKRYRDEEKNCSSSSHTAGKRSCAADQSKNRIGSDIEKMLINAAENSLQQFKKQQASEFISNKLKMVQSMSFSQALPVHMPVPVTPYTTVNPAARFTTPTGTLFLSHSSTVNHLFHQQVIFPQKTMPSIYHTAAAPTVSVLPYDSKVSDQKTVTKSCEIKSSVDAELSFLRRSSSSKVGDNNSTDKPNGEETKSNGKSESNDVMITRVVQSKSRNVSNTTITTTSSTTAKRIVHSSKRKVTIKKHNDKKTSTPIQDESKKKVRVPSWFTGRCIELFKKRHKKIQQLKHAQIDASGGGDYVSVGSIKEALRGIDREYIPLCKKTKSQYMQSGASNEQKGIKSIGLDEAIVGESDSQ